MKTRVVALTALIGPLTAYAYACGGSDNASSGGADASAGSDSGGNDGATGGDAGDGSAVTCANRNPMKNPYFGDLHAHTSYSFDAYSFDTRNTPFDAYAFAKGKTVQVAGAAADGGGPLTTIERPLDFLAVTDHSEWLALAFGCGDALDGGAYDPQSPYYGAPECVTYRSTDPATQARTFGTSKLLQDKLCEAGTCDGVVRSAWQSVQQAAAAAYEPCKFTSFVAYEWTHAFMGATLHKNVVFGTDKVPDKPIDAFNYGTQVALWNALDEQCDASAGCEAITIPHNSNLSQGGAFYVPPGSEAHMVKYQRLVEIFQHKGGSECFFDANNPIDPACDFEYLGGITESNNPKSYVRTGLEEGLSTYATTKVNPLQMGIIGATDDHNGAPGNVREDTWPGHAGRLDDSPQRRIGLGADGGANGVSHGHNPGGVAVAWAEENTRESIFAALMRRETYATSGPRIVVRFYQTWDATSDPCADSQFPSKLLASGAVPMGATFSPPSGGDAGATKPRLVAYAWKDKVDLARVDIVKAWIDGTGQVKEEVMKNDVVSNKPACFVFTDASFVSTPTFYYARVLETPTPRWSVGDCAADPTANPAGCADGGYLNTMIQERAWTSPIWFLP